MLLFSFTPHGAIKKIQTPEQTQQMKRSQLHDFNNLQIRDKTGILKKQKISDISKKKNAEEISSPMLSQ